ncbi:Bidirectional sugar transporter NEC1 [Linum grandiflorum]
MSSACRPTFYKIYKKKSSQGFHSIPYVTALMSAMLLLYYGFLKTNATLIITINAIGITIELVYLSVYLFYSPSRELMFTVKMLVCSLGGYGAMMLVTEFWLRGSSRMNTIGWICAVFNIAVFAAPLSIVRNVIKTKSVEYMPFTLSLFLTLCATAWFFYGLLVNDYYIALPNVLGFLFGITQMILYMVYKDATRQVGDGEMSKQEEEANNVENHFIEMGSVAHNKHNG